MGARERALNVLLTMASAEPTLEGVRRVNAAVSRGRRWAHGRRRLFFEEAGVATARDLARVEAEVFEVIQALREVSARLASLEARLSPPET